jgi:hypothetical protein
LLSIAAAMVEIAAAIVLKVMTNPQGGLANERTGPWPVAEEVGFEPTVPFPVRRFSRPLP